MTSAFVHGNPETAALWRVLLDELADRGVDDVVTLSPPGFGAPVPAGWEPTRANYTDWLVAELEELGGQVDLVGHDWGAGHVFGALDARPDLIRTWATDCGGLLHPDYVWHDMAQVWQTPGAGEEAVAAMFGGEAADRAQLLESLGMRADVAADIAARQDDTTGACVLALYRSAAQPALAQLGERLRGASLPPGLVLVATEDPYTGTPEMAREVAAGMGASTVDLEGCGHWWMFGDGVAPAADALAAHWDDGPSR